MNDEMEQYLKPTETIDFNHPAVCEFAAKGARGARDPRERAVNLYYAVRDGIRYDPYAVDLSPKGFRASTTLEVGRAWCVPKAILLAGCCRAMGIPARLGFADVRNHLSTARMRQRMKTDVFAWHGYTSIHLAGVWIKATPAFNIELCERCNLRPLEFDGCRDAIYHPFDRDGNRHMEYIKDRGEYPDAPIGLIAETFQREYSSLLSLKDLNFDHDVEREMRADKAGDEVPPE
jgi:transglutaminase-like putative cysteine protease